LSRLETINIHFNNEYVRTKGTGYFMDEHVEDGNAFAVPDLWETSTLAHFEFDQNPTSRLFLNLEPLGMSLALKYVLQNFSTDSLQQIQKMTQE